MIKKILWLFLVLFSFISYSFASCSNWTFTDPWLYYNSHWSQNYSTTIYDDFNFNTIKNWTEIPYVFWSFFWNEPNYWYLTFRNNNNLYSIMNSRWTVSAVYWFWVVKCPAWQFDSDIWNHMPSYYDSLPLLEEIKNKLWNWQKIEKINITYDVAYMFDICFSDACYTFIRDYNNPLSDLTISSLNPFDTDLFQPLVISSGGGWDSDSDSKPLLCPTVWDLVVNMSLVKWYDVNYCDYYSVWGSWKVVDLFQSVNSVNRYSQLYNNSCRGPFTVEYCNNSFDWHSDKLNYFKSIPTDYDPVEFYEFCTLFNYDLDTPICSEDFTGSISDHIINDYSQQAPNSAISDLLVSLNRFKDKIPEGSVLQILWIDSLDVSFDSALNFIKSIPTKLSEFLASIAWLLPYRFWINWLVPDFITVPFTLVLFMLLLWKFRS